MEERKMGIGVGIILCKDNQVLLGLRHSDPQVADSDMHLEGTWTLPSGKVKFGESFEQAGIRKVKEECNLDVHSIHVISVQNDMNEFAHYATIGLLADSFSGTIVPIQTQELIRFKWFSPNSLPENLCFPSQKILEAYQSHQFYLPEKKKEC